MSAASTTDSVISPPAAQPAPELRIETVTDERAFLQLEPVWDRVMEASGAANPFLEFLWARSWGESFGAGSDLHILVVWSADRPIAIAPLIATRTTIDGVPLKTLGFLYNDHVPRADFLIAERAAECSRAIWSHLAAHAEWDLLQLCQLPADSPT